jgi:hypothetical protein
MFDLGLKWTGFTSRRCIHDDGGVGPNEGLQRSLKQFVAAQKNSRSIIESRFEYRRGERFGPTNFCRSTAILVDLKGRLLELGDIRHRQTSAARVQSGELYQVIELHLHIFELLDARGSRKHSWRKFLTAVRMPWLVRA